MQHEAMNVGKQMWCQFSRMGAKEKHSITDRWAILVRLVKYLSRKFVMKY